MNGFIGMNKNKYDKIIILTKSKVHFEYIF